MPQLRYQRLPAAVVIKISFMRLNQASRRVIAGMDAHLRTDCPPRLASAPPPRAVQCEPACLPLLQAWLSPASMKVKHCFTWSLAMHLLHGKFTEET